MSENFKYDGKKDLVIENVATSWEMQNCPKTITKYWIIYPESKNDRENIFKIFSSFASGF